MEAEAETEAEAEAEAELLVVLLHLHQLHLHQLHLQLKCCLGSRSWILRKQSLTCSQVTVGACRWLPF